MEVLADRKGVPDRDAAVLEPRDEELSPHLRSRAEVAAILLDSGVPTAVLRAAVVLGSGSASFEMLRYLTERLPVMVTPRWVHSRIQPIAIRDVLRYLVGCAQLPADVHRCFDIGGPDVMDYAEMMQRVARTHHHRSLPMLTIPLLTPRLSSHWLAFVTDVDTRTARNLVDSMSNEVVVHDDSIKEVVPGEPLDYTAAIEEAYAARAQALTA